MMKSKQHTSTQHTWDTDTALVISLLTTTGTISNWTIYQQHKHIFFYIIMHVYSYSKLSLRFALMLSKLKQDLELFIYSEIY